MRSRELCASRGDDRALQWLRPAHGFMREAGAPISVCCDGSAPATVGAAAGMSTRGVPSLLGIWLVQTWACVQVSAHQGTHRVDRHAPRRSRDCGPLWRRRIGGWAGAWRCGHFTLNGRR